MTQSHSHADSQRTRFLFFVVVAFMFGCGSTDQPAKTRTERVERLILELPAEYPDADYTDFRFAGVKMVAPAKFAPASRFHGFVHEETSACVTITTSPVPFDITKESIKNLGKNKGRGIVEGFTKSITVEGQEGVYTYLFQKMSNGMFEKHVLAFGNNKKSWTIAGVYPEELQSQFGLEVLKSIMSARPVPISLADEFDPDVNFTLSAPTLSRTPGWSKSIVFTKNGIYPLSRPIDPFFRATPSVDIVHVAEQNRAKFALAQLKNTPDVKLLEVFINRDVTIDGLPGREIMAIAKDLATGTPVLLYRTILFEGESYINMQGRVGQNVLEDFTAEFKAIARSLKRKTEEPAKARDAKQ